MPRQRTSPVWKLSKEEFQILVNSCKSRVEILERLGLNGYSGNHTTLNRRIKEEHINIEHILENYKNKLKYAMIQRAIPLADILVENSTYSRRQLKKRLLREGLLEEKCYKCGIGPIWNDEELSLQLDHKNGISNDNRLENLWILCPNCHSQTSTFSGKNARTGRCIDCSEKIRAGYTRCGECENESRFNKNTKTIWPSNDDLLEMLKKSNFVQVAKQLGVSDNAIRHRLKRRGLI